MGFLRTVKGRVLAIVLNILLVATAVAAITPLFALGATNVAWTNFGTDCRWKIETVGTEVTLTIAPAEGKTEGTIPNGTQCNKTTWSAYKKIVTRVVFTGKVKAPANGSPTKMFQDFSKLTYVDLSGLDGSTVTSMSNMFSGCSSLTSINLSNFDTSKVTSMKEMFSGCSSLTSLDVSNFDTSNVTDLAGMFEGCSSLTSLDVSNFDTSYSTATKKNTGLASMFEGCSSLTSLDVSNFDTSNVNSLSCMFKGCSKLTSLDVSNFDTSNVTDLAGMFEGCSSLTSLDVSNFDTSKVKGLGGMFEGCSKLTSLDLSNFDTSNINKTMNHLFEGCSSLTSLDLSNFDTSKVTGMQGMFAGCSSLTTLNLSNFDTSELNDMQWMFTGCSSLTTLNLLNFDTSSVIHMQEMFKGCSSLKTILVGNGWTTNKVTGAIDDADMFTGCTSLVGGKGTTLSSKGGIDDKTYACYDQGPDSSAPGYLTLGPVDKTLYLYEGKVYTDSIHTILLDSDIATIMGITYDEATSTWTMDGFHFITTAQYGLALLDSEATTINTVHTNAVKSCSTASLSMGVFSLSSKATTTFNGTGTLKIVSGDLTDADSVSSALYAMGNLVIANAKLEGIGGKAQGAASVSAGIGCYKNLTINGDNTKVIATGGAAGQASYGVYLTSGILNVIGNNASLVATSGEAGEATYGIHGSDQGCMIVVGGSAGVVATSQTGGKAISLTSKIEPVAKATITDTTTNLVWDDKNGNYINGSTFESPLSVTLAPDARIVVGAQTGTLTYKTAGSVTYTISQFPETPAFTSFKVLWKDAQNQWSESAPTGVSASFSTDNKTLTLSTTASAAAGTYTFKVTALKEESTIGSAEATLSVDTLSIANCTVSDIAAQTFANEQITPSITVSDGAATLVKNIDYTLSYGENVNAGENAGSITITGMGDYAGTKTVNFTIAKKVLSVSDTTITSKKYDGTTTATVTSNGTLSDKLEGADVSIASVAAVFADKNAGKAKDVKVTYTLAGADKDNYTVEEQTVKANITARSITLTSASDTKTYNGTALTNSNVSDSGDGFIAGEGATYNVTGTITTLGSADNTFTYELNQGTNASNYTITTVTGTLTITAITTPITITAGSAIKVYDGTALTSDEFTYTQGVLASGDTLKVTTTGTITDFGTTSNTVASYKVENANGEDVTGCYTINSPVDGTLSITKRAITLTSASKSRAYDGTVLTCDTVKDTLNGSNPTVAGFVTGEGATYTVTGSQTTLGHSSNTFTYILKEGTKAENYEISTGVGTLEITAITTPITIAAASATKTYDGTALTDNTFTFTQGILASGDTLKVTTTGTITDFGTTSNTVASYKVENANGEDVTGYYTFGPSEDGTLSITKRAITLSSASKSRVYDGTALTCDTVKDTLNGSNPTVAGFVTGEGATYTVTGSQTTLGHSSNTFTYILKEGTKAENYEISTGVGTLEITAITTPITIATASATKTYDGTALTDNTFTFTNDILVSGDTLTAVVEGTITNFGETTNKVTSYKVTNAADVDVTDCYTFATTEDGKLSITKRSVTLESASNAQTYNGKALTDSAVSVKGEGFAEGEGATYSVTGAQTTVGMSKNTFTYALNNGTMASNYTITTLEGELRVNAIDNPVITITAASGSKVYDGKALTDNTYTYTKDVIVAGDTLSVVVEGTITNAGTAENKVVSYKVTNAEGTDVTNCYTITTLEGELRVNAIDNPAITITAASGSKVYDGKALTDNTYTYTKDVIVAGDTLSVVVEGTITNAGTAENKVVSYKVTNAEGTDVTNCYTFATPVSGKLEVTKRAVTVTAENKATDSKAFGQTVDYPEFSVVVEGTLSGEASKIVYNTPTTDADISKSGEYAITVTGNATQGNYEVTFVSGILTVSDTGETTTTIIIVSGVAVVAAAAAAAGAVVLVRRRRH